MLDVHRAAARPKGFVREPEPVRVRALRDAFRRVGNVPKAAFYERRLAEIETREPEVRAVDASAKGEHTMSAERRWDARCSEILQRMAGRCHDHEIAASIEAETGKRFSPCTVAEYRRAGGLSACRRNDWTVPLRTLPRR